MLVRKRQVIFWITNYVIVCYIIQQYIGVNQGYSQCLNDGMIYDLILSPQKLFFNNAIAFAILTYISNKAFFSTELMIRYGQRLFCNIMLHGLVLVVLFTFVTFGVTILTAVFYGLSIHFSYLQSGVMLFLFILLFYNIYILSYCLTNKTFLGMTTLIVYGVLIVMIYVFHIF